MIAFLIIQGLAFAVWTFFFFRALFQIRAIAARETDSFNPGPVSFLAAARVWMRDPATRITRLGWLAAFAVMTLATILTAMQTPPPQ
jgi:uncharacterized membrane protein